MLAGRVDDRSSLGDIDRERLFRVHVLAGLTGQNRDSSAGMIGSGDDDRVELFLLEHLAVILVNGPLRMSFLRGVVGPFEITIGDGNDVPGRRKLVHQHLGPIPAADEADDDTFVGRWRRGRGMLVGVEQMRQRNRPGRTGNR